MTALKSDYDIVLEPPGEEPIGLMLYRKPRRDRAGGIGPYQISGSLISEAAAQEQHWVRQDYDDFSAGSFYSRRIVPNGHAWTEDGDASLPGLFLPSGRKTTEGLEAQAREIDCSAEFEGDLYFAGIQYIFRVTGGTGAVAVVSKDLGASATVRSLVVFDGALYAAGTNMNIWRLSGGSWVEATFARRYLAVVDWRIQDRARWVLVGVNTQNWVNYVEGDPFDPNNWTPAPLGATGIQIGNDGTDITAVTASSRHVYFVKSDTGLHDLNAQGSAPTLTPYWQHAHSEPGPIEPLIHEGFVYIPTSQGLDRIDVRDEGRLQQDPGWCQPGFGLPNETPVRGEITALAAVAGWIWAAVYDGTDSWLCKGKDRAKLGLEGAGPLAWYTQSVIRGEQVTHLRPAAPDGVPRLWIASTAANVATLRWMSLPKGGNPIQELLWGGSHRFETSCVLVTSSDIWGNAAAKKTMRRLGVTSERLGELAAFGIDLSVGSPSALEWVEQQTVRVSEYESFLTTNETGYRTTLRVRGSGTATGPPILRGLVPRADLYVEQDELWAYQVVLGEGVTLRSGVVDGRDQAAVHARLKYLAELGHMTMRDELGEELEVIVQPSLPWQAAESPTVPDAQQRVLTLTVSVVDRGLYWDTGGAWDAGYTWS